MNKNYIYPSERMSEREGVIAMADYLKRLEAKHLERLNRVAWNALYRIPERDLTWEDND